MMKTAIATRRPRRAAVATGALITASTLIVTLAACSTPGGAAGTTSAPATGSVTKMAWVGPENETDLGWNQIGLANSAAAAKQLGIDYTSIPDAGWDNTETVLNQVIQDGANFVIAHASGYGVAAKTVASQTKVPILIQDSGISPVPGQIAEATVSAQQGGYIAGIAAAKATTSHTVAVVISADDVNWLNMAAGYAEGVYSVDPTITVLFGQISANGYADSAGGKAAVDTVIAGGADVVFGMGDGATLGYIQSINEHPGVKYIADLGDVSSAITDPKSLLTTIVWDYTSTYVQAVKDVAAGTFGTVNYDLNVSNRGLYLQDTTQMTTAMKDAVQTATSAIGSGSLVPDGAANSDAVKAIIAAKKAAPTK